MVLDKLVDTAQFAFVKDRFILDGVALAQEIIASCHFKYQDGILLKLDIEKAFDKVDWNFLLCVLKARGFINIWISWIRACLCSGISFVLVNDKEGRILFVKEV